MPAENLSHVESQREDECNENKDSQVTVDRASHLRRPRAKLDKFTHTLVHMSLRDFDFVRCREIQWQRSLLRLFIITEKAREVERGNETVSVV